jgi:OOP family OmpA-OmpF porin
MSRGSLFVGLVALALGRAAAADDSGVYVAAGVGLVDTPNNSVLGVQEVGELTGKTDDGDASWGISAGYRFNRYIAIELGYLDLGEITSEVTDATGSSDAHATVGFSAEGVTLALLGTFPIGQRWEPYLKAGVFYARTVLEFSGSSSGDDFGARVTHENGDALFGIGVRYAISERLQIYLDSTYFREIGEPSTGHSEALNTSLGVSWRF